MSDAHAPNERKLRASTLTAGAAAALAFVVGSALLYGSFDMRSTMSRVDLAAMPAMLDGLAARPPTQKGYDLALRFARDEHQSVVELVDLVLAQTKVTIAAGVAFYAVAGLLAYAWLTRSRA